MDPLSRVKATDFKGRVSVADAHDLPDGAFQTFDNLQVYPGMPIVRGGLRPKTDRATHNIIAMYHYQRPEADWIVWENANGDLKASRYSASTLGTPITIATGLNTFQPLCFAKGRNHALIAVNGVDRGMRWDGLTAAVEPLGIDAPTTAPTMATGSAGAFSYLCSYRYLDDDQGFVRPQQGVVTGPTLSPDTEGPQPSSLSPDATITGSATSGVTYTWSAIAQSLQSRVVKVQLWRTLSDETETTYLVATLGHNGSISTVTTSAGTNKVTTTAAHNLLTGARVTIAGVTGGSSINGARVVTVVNATSFTIGTAYSADGAGGTWTLTGYAESTSDAALELLTPMSYVSPDGRHYNARRFTPPPDTKPYVCFYLDRAWYLGAVHYNVGTVTTNSTTTLTGSGTNWTAQMVGRWVTIQGETKPFVVATFTNSTTLVLDRAATTSAGSLYYAISPSPVERNQISFSEPDEPESTPDTNVLPLQENTGDDDEVTGVIPTGEGLLIGKERHLVYLRAVRQPELDATPDNVCRRGMLNFRCAAWFENLSYWMDQTGIYRFSGQGDPEPISEPIADLWQLGTLDFSRQKWFHCQVDPLQAVIRWHVAFVGDTGTRPKRWLEYDLRGKSWATGSCVEELGGACLLQWGSQLRVLVGGQAEVVLLTGEGTSDVISTAIQGTATGGSATTLVDSTANFVSAGIAVGTPVGFVTGAAKGETRRVSAVATTTLTIDSGTTPVAGDVYLLGGIPWMCKTGRLAFLSSGPRGDEYHKRSVRLVFQPTTSAAQLDIRRYYNHESSPVVHATSQDLGTNVTATLDSADAVVNLLATRSAQATQAGFAEWKYGGGMSDRSQATRWVAVELRGFQGLDLIKLYELAFDSVEG